MSDREARMPALLPPEAPRVFGGDEEDRSGFHLTSIPDEVKLFIVEKMNPGQIYKVQMLNKHMYELMQNYPNLCKPGVIVDISTADHYHPKLYNKPGSHVLAVTLKKMPPTYPIVDDEMFPAEMILTPMGTISHSIVYEKPNLEDMIETHSVRACFEKTLTKVRIAELTINFGDVPVTPNMMSIMEEWLSHEKQCYDRLALRLISRDTDLGAYANLLHAIKPLRFKFEGNHCLNIEKIFLPDIRLFIRDNEMGSSEVIIRVARIVEDWYFGRRDFKFVYVQFGSGGALLPRLIAYEGFPLVEVMNYDCVVHYMVTRGDLELHIRIQFNQVRLIVIEAEKDE